VDILGKLRGVGADVTSLQETVAQGGGT